MIWKRISATVFLLSLFFVNFLYCEESRLWRDDEPQGASVKMVLSAEKETYVAGEPAELTVALVNMTGLDKGLNVRVCPRLDIDSYIYVAATDGAGKRYKGFLGSGEDLTTFHLHTAYALKPREEKRFKFNLAHLFTAKNTEQELPITDIAKAPGSYKLVAGISEIALESVPIIVTISEQTTPPAP